MLQRTYYYFVERSVILAENHRVPLPTHFVKDKPLQGSMDNFDHEENTMSVIGGSHDTVLVLFQSESEHNDTRLRIDDFAIDKQQNHVFCFSELPKASTFY